jgi:hypothetical protein
MQTIDIRRSVVRLVGVLAVMAALALPAVASADGPIEMGLTECGPGDTCTTSRTLAAAQRYVSLNPVHPLRPHLIP